MISECALSCVCACFFVPVLIACVNVCCIVRSILKLLCIFWWMTLLRYIRGPGLLLLETENSFHSCWVIVCVYVWYGCVCVSSRLLWTDSLFCRGHGKTAPLWFNYHSEYSWRGNKRLGDIMVWFTQVFWHRVEQRGLSVLKRALTSLISPFCLFLLKVSKLSPHAISETAIADLTPNPLCVRAHLCWIQFG